MNLEGSMVTSVHIRSTALFFLHEQKNLVLVFDPPFALDVKGGEWVGVVVCGYCMRRLLVACGRFRPCSLDNQVGYRVKTPLAASDTGVNRIRTFLIKMMTILMRNYPHQYSCTSDQNFIDGKSSLIQSFEENCVLIWRIVLMRINGFLITVVDETLYPHQNSCTSDLNYIDENSCIINTLDQTAVLIMRNRSLHQKWKTLMKNQTNRSENQNFWS